MKKNMNLIPKPKKVLLQAMIDKSVRDQLTAARKKLGYKKSEFVEAILKRFFEGK